MPKSRRSKIITLAQTDKKGRENKERLFDDVRAALDQYRYVWVLNLADVRTPVLQEIRQDWAGLTLVMGKRRVLQKALGDDAAEEYKENLAELLELCGLMPGLLFTDEEPDTVKGYFAQYKKADFSRAKQKLPIDFTIPAGVIFSRGGQIPEEEDVPMAHSLEETFRNKYKVPTKMKSGKITIAEPYHVCSKGDVLDVRQALILKQFGIAALEFQVTMVAWYDGETLAVTKVDN